MDIEEYGPLSFFIGNWNSGKDWTGENQAPSPSRATENTKFRQETKFEAMDIIKNHEQTLYPLRYYTIAWEEGSKNPFHEEVGYWIWDPADKQVLKSFIVPRGVSVNAGGTVQLKDQTFKLTASLGSETYGICSNKFLNIEFKTVGYELEISKIDGDSFSYSENTMIKIKGQEKIFDHTEKNTMFRGN